MKHVSEILPQIPAVEKLKQYCKVGKVTVNPAKCKANKKPCHPTEFFATAEKCKQCNRIF